MISKETKNLIKDIVYIVAFFLVFITFGWIAFHIPSSSMEPTLEVGDRIFVSKWAYGYNRYSVPGDPSFIGEGRLFEDMPSRGEVAVFTKKGVDYIKRVIGVPGDKIQVKEGRLYINGVRVHRTLIREVDYIDYRGIPRSMKEYNETLPSSEGGEPVIHRIYEASDYNDNDDTVVFTVPADHFFMMGDNRDVSKDSRAMWNGIGFIRKEELVGRAQVTTFSLYDCDQGKPIYCPMSVPLGRFFNVID
ncbi:signal peptidase I [Temperatibacter marinus]|uniref:Signal peptidase I n=1 Tax=Temperatibacter marinus TaxID=1456591 RepID=A0AA52EKF8_9PROT|nr:signal peptidase I [Temperatibacter marinus]WND03656.1 signal peptidase I [Temperatibacter marinus]